MDIYEKIREENKRKHGERRQITAAHLSEHVLHTDNTNVLKELLQNAEDAQASMISFQFREDGILVQNNGRPFTEQDLFSLCSYFESSKDLSGIGYFGIGFKAVLQLTETPYLVSGPYCCYLDGGIDPYEVSVSDLPFRADPNNTYFWLPRHKDLPWEKIGSRLSEKLKQNGPELLLFMDNIRYLRWQRGDNFFEYHIDQETLTKNTLLITVSNGRISHWLRFDAFPVLPPVIIEQVLSKLLNRTLKQEIRDRFEANINRPQRVSIAFQIESDSPAEITGLIYAGLPTEQETGFKFHLDARFQTGIDRGRIKNPKEDPLISWLIDQLTELAGSIPQRLRDINWLKPAVWPIFPLPGEAKEFFVSISDALLNSLKSGAFIPDSEGRLHSPSEVFLSHRKDLYFLLSLDNLRDLTGVKDAVWPHPELQIGRSAKLLEHLGVREIGAEQVIAWLEQKLADEDWGRLCSDDWLKKLYEYLNRVQQNNISLREKIRGLPLVRTRNGRLITPSQAFFPPEKMVDPVLEPYLHDFDSVIVKNVENKDVVEFLKWAGVREFDWTLLLERLFSLEYGTKKAPLEKKPSSEANHRHLCVFKKLYEQGQIEPAKIREIGSNYPILRNRKREYVIPSEAYLSEEYSTDEDEREAYAAMERFYELAGGRPFVSPSYLVTNRDKDQNDHPSDSKDWQNFLFSLGITNTTARLIKDP